MGFSANEEAMRKERRSRGSKGELGGSALSFSS